MSAVDRRTALALGGAALAATLPAPAPSAPSGGLLLFDPQSVTARRLARAAKGQRLVALKGDPVRLWKELDDTRPVSGLTSWSDYLILRGLAEAQGLRVRREEHHRAPGMPLLVSWTAA